MQWRALGKAADELIEELFGADLEVERVAAVLHADVKELYGGERGSNEAGQLFGTFSASRATF